MRTLYIVALALTCASCGGGGSDSIASSPVAVTPATGATTSTPSAPTVSTAPDDVTKQAFANFEFSATNAESFECSLDGVSFEACSSPHIVFPLKVGEHSLVIRYLDGGETSDEAATTWTVSSIFGDGADTALDAGLTQSTMTPSPVEPNSWRGIYRVNCDFSHSDYDDPIVFPGMDGAAHLHRFYGNMLLDENTTLTSLFTTGDSSCQGNKLNRSAYWIPALIAPSYNPDTGARLTDSKGDPAWKAVPAVVGNDDVAHEIFYYSAGVDELDTIDPIPLGLRMIAGEGSAGPDAQQDTAIVRWHCQSWESSDASNPRWSTSIPECLAPDRLRMDIFFPSCWDGQNLDSSDHKSHLTYPTVTSGFPNGTFCPATHPVAIMRVSFHYAWGVTPDVYDPVTMTSKGWRIASDTYDVDETNPGGMSLHGDWFNAWHPEALEAILTECIQKELDCHDGNYGNGARLSGTQPGAQNDPEIINMGHGLGSGH